MLSLVPFFPTVHPAAATLADFSVSAGIPSPDHLKPGDSTTSTITVQSNGVFVGDVYLSTTNINDLTFSFDTNPVSVNTLSPVATSTLTITAMSSASPGSYAITVAGQCQALICPSPSSHSAPPITVTVDQVATGDFSISGSPNNLDIPMGSKQTSTIALSSTGGLAGTVHLSSSVSPLGLSVSCDPSDIGLAAGGTGHSTCTLAASNLAGSYSVTVTGSLGSLSHSASITVQVYQNQSLADFSITANPQSFTVEAGHRYTSKLTVTSKNNFNGEVDLLTSTGDAVADPARINVPSGGSANSNLIVTGSQPGRLDVTITATSQQATTHTFTVVVNVVGFSLTGPSSIVCQSGLTCSSDLQVTSLSGFSGSVILSTAHPKDLSASINPTSVSLSPGQNVTITLNVTSTYVRPFFLVVNATTGDLSHWIDMSVRITDFTVEASPSSLTVLAGSLTNTTVTLTSVDDFRDFVSLSATSSMSGVSPSLSVTLLKLQPNKTARSTLAVTVADAVTGGTYTVTVSGTSYSGLVHTANVTLVVVTDFAVSADSSSLGLPIGGSTTSRLTVSGSSSFTGSIDLSATCSPSGVDLALDQQNVKLGPGRHIIVATLTISSNSSAVPGTYTILIVGTSGTQSRNATIVLALTPDPQISAPSSLKVNAGSLVVFTVTASDFDTSKWISLYAISSSMPSSATFTTVSGTGSVRGVFNWAPSQARDLGEHNITFTVTDDHGGKASTSIIVTVNPVNRSGFSMGAAGLISIAVVAAVGLVLVGNLAWKGKLRLAGAWLRSLVKSRRSERRA